MENLIKMNSFEGRPLFKECIEILCADVLSNEASLSMQELFEELYPITEWGKIDWDKINNKIEVGYNQEDILPALAKLFDSNVDQSVYVLWSSASIPIIRTNLMKIIENYDYVTCVSFEKFIFNPAAGYIVEILTSDKITAGRIST